MSKTDTILDENRAKLALASDPKVSAWVSANAGSGKTHVLTKRVMRLLLAGVPPSRILCLTYTKAAAAEMSNRVFSTLGHWASLGVDALGETLEEFLDRSPKAGEIARAPILFALSLESPGGLKIQTIHAFCEALLHQFPLEANVSGHFDVIDSAAQGGLLAEAQRQVILELETPAPSVLQANLRTAFACLIELANDQAIDKGLAELTGKRESFLQWVAAGVETAMQPLWQQCGIGQGADEATILAEGLADTLFGDDELKAFAEAGAPGLEFMLCAQSLPERFRARNNVFLTKGTAGKRKPRENPFPKSVVKAFSDLEARLEVEKHKVLDQFGRHQAWKILKSSQALFELGEAILERYGALKRRRGLADFNDLISSAANLLTRTEVRQWVQYKLDRGIDHVLIDEAQDTSPRQWAIINAMVEDFHAGASTRLRTVFAVGDEKQSIYSFQGADPKRFSQEAAALGSRARSSGQQFADLRLHLSFRSVPDVLEAVDKVFSEPDNFRGLSTREAKTEHEAVRRRDPGEVMIWPLLGKQKQAEKTSWLAPLDQHGSDHPAEILAARIASTIASWIKAGEKLPGRDRPVRCGDILILVRRRDVFSTAVIRQLKEHGLAIAGADRLQLNEHIAVEDLIALGRAVLMPEDDLSLACVLKSPLFGFDDGDLIDLACNRKHVPLYEHLALLADSGNSGTAKMARNICARFANWRNQAAQVGAYAFFAGVLGRDGGRMAFLSRLGTEAADVLDAFEQAALEHEINGGKGLEDFIAGLTRNSPEIKRETDMREDAIRVITVHSAKGLEAPVVFLIDPCAPAFDKKHRPAIIEFQSGAGGFLWANGNREAIKAILEHDMQTEIAAEEEYRRLLYVGMTRAADRLIVCGWHGVNAPSRKHWHLMVTNALQEEAEIVEMTPRWQALRWASRSERTTAARREVALKETSVDNVLIAEDMPAWLLRNAPAEPAIPRPLTPSGAAAFLALQNVPGQAGEALLSGDGQLRQLALLRGKLTHRLLQWLPEREPAERQAYAKAIASKFAPELTAGAVDAASNEVLALLQHLPLACLFGKGSRAEVAVAGHLRLGNRDVLVSGQIDRLAILGDTVEIADYKTSREAAVDRDGIAKSHVLQMALYRNLLRQIYPGKSIACSLIWTHNCTVTSVGDNAMDAALAAMTIA